MPTPKKPAAKTAASSKTGNRDDAAVTHAEEAIRIVLDVSGHYDVPVTEPGIRKKSLADNLDYTADLLDVLQIELDKYVGSVKPGALISEDEIGNCETVGDVVDLVEGKI